MATTPASSSLRRRPATASPRSRPNSMLPICVRNRMWHPIEPIDNDPVAFAARLLAGLERLAPFSPEMRAVAERSATRMDTEMVPMLLSVMRQREPLRITFDDAHHLVSPASLSILQQIITGIGQRSQVVIATRVAPELGLARLRASGDLAEIGPNELAMDLDATSAVLGRLGIELDPRTTEALHHRTEGWPAGLALAGIAISNSPGSEAPVIPSGRRREIADYLVDEVLSQQSDEVRAFLVRIALLRRFNAQLCDAMLASRRVRTTSSTGSTGSTCSWCRSTTNAVGTGSTTCSANC